jgi:hypothetical protein
MWNSTNLKFDEKKNLIIIIIIIIVRLFLKTLYCLPPIEFQFVKNWQYLQLSLSTQPFIIWDFPPHFLNSCFIFKNKLFKKYYLKECIFHKKILMIKTNLFLLKNNL